MKEIFLGEFIKQRRLELGLTQGQLCEGICEPMTISRIENGRQTPSRNRINALLQRLGLPDDRYYALLSKNEAEVAGLQREIISCNIRHKTEQGLEKIQALEQIIDKDDRITQQFILRSKVLLGKRDGEYSFNEKLDMLMAAIRLTVPRFDLEEINSFLYSFDEVKVINQITKVYSENGQHKKAVDILSQLLKYVQRHYQNILQSGGYLPLIAHNYAKELGECKRYEDAIEIAELGWKSCVEYGHYQFLPGILAIMAECHYFLGEQEKSIERYCQSYYLYKAIDNKEDCLIIRDEVKKRLNIKFKY